MTNLQDDDLKFTTRSLDMILDITREYDDPDDAISMLYALWVALTRRLAEDGWPADELVKSAQRHATDAALIVTRRDVLGESK